MLCHGFNWHSSWFGLIIYNSFIPQSNPEVSPFALHTHMNASYLEEQELHNRAYLSKMTARHPFG